MWLRHTSDPPQMCRDLCQLNTICFYVVLKLMPLYKPQSRPDADNYLFLSPWGPPSITPAINLLPHFSQQETIFRKRKSNFKMQRGLRHFNHSQNTNSRITTKELFQLKNKVYTHTFTHGPLCLIMTSD